MIWFTSDWHLGHGRIIELCGRPFDTTREMNAWLIDNANEQTDPVDTIVFPGDVAMGQMAESLPLFERLHARLILKPGNHDRCSPLYEGYHGMAPEKVAAKVAEWTARYKDVGFTVTTDNWFSYLGFEAVINHFPYHGDPSGEERYPEARPVDKGDWLLHGHTHGLWRQRGKMIDVGVDAWGGKLVSAATLASMAHAGPAMLDPLPWVV